MQQKRKISTVLTTLWYICREVIFAKALFQVSVPIDTPKEMTLHRFGEKNDAQHSFDSSV